MKTAVVTGGGSGIGLAVAHRLRADGLDVATIDLRPSDTDLAFTADVTDRSQVDAALAAIRARLGPSRFWSTPRAWTGSSASATSRSRSGSE